MRFSPRRILLFASVLSLSPFALLAQPTARTGARMAFHEEIGKIILFGGVTPPDSSGIRYPLGDTWEWTGRRWVRIFPSHSPSPRSDFSLVYDSNRTRLLLFGGTTAVNEVVNDSWSYDNGDWAQLDTAAVPPARRLAGAAFDPTRDRVVLFGGSAATGNLFDTWEFDGTTWKLANESGPKVTSPNLVYDEARKATVMLGFGEGGASEMYQWNGATWDKLAPAELPDCVSQGAFVYQEHDQTLLYYGGLCSTGFATDETWQWDGANWTKLETTSAGAIFSAAAAYDAIRQEIVLFGGAARNFTYRFANNRWIFVENNFTPGPRSQMVFESDPARGVIWLFGGLNESSRFADLWSFSFDRWQKIIAPDAPAGCDFPNGAFDKDRERLVILCEDSATYEWDGTKWYTFANLSTKPPVRRWSSMVYDERNKKMVMFGGYDGEYLKETWMWDGREWKRAEKKNSPPSRALAALFWDPTQQRVMLYGGIGRPTSEDAVVRYADMWNFDGTSWVEMKNTTTPPARYGAFVDTSPLTNRVVLFGGKDEKEKYLDEHWEWNGSTWQRIDSAARPSARMNGGLAFDPSRATLTLFGGYAGAYFSEVWELDGDRWELRPELSPGRRRPALNSGQREEMCRGAPAACP